MDQPQLRKAVPSIDLIRREIRLSYERIVIEQFLQYLSQPFIYCIERHRRNLTILLGENIIVLLGNKWLSLPGTLGSNQYDTGS